MRQKSTYSGDRVYLTEETALFIDYPQSPQGHEIASRAVGLIEEAKQATINKNYSHAKFNRWLEAGVILAVAGTRQRWAADCCRRALES